eukprot:scaffold55374_cov59-Phaeocystis_antarctica.AAC.1
MQARTLLPDGHAAAIIRAMGIVTSLPPTYWQVRGALRQANSSPEENAARKKKFVATETKARAEGKRKGVLSEAEKAAKKARKENELYDANARAEGKRKGVLSEAGKGAKKAKRVLLAEVAAPLVVVEMNAADEKQQLERAEKQKPIHSLGSYKSFPHLFIPESSNSAAYRQQKLGEVAVHDQLQLKRDAAAEELRRKDAHCLRCDELVKQVHESPDGAQGEEFVEMLEIAMDVRSEHVFHALFNGTRQYLWSGEKRVAALKMLRERYSRERKAREGDALSRNIDFSPKMRESVLKGCEGQRVYWIFQNAVAYEIDMFVSQKKLDGRFEKLAVAF